MNCAPIPALTKEDLPTPDEPATSSTPCSSSARTAPDSSCSRPKYRSASTTPAGGRPKYGHSGLAARNTWSDSSEGSCRRIACSSSASSVHGSSPSSAASSPRALRTVASASACRPCRYCATLSTTQRRSRNGASATRARADAVDLLNLTRLQPCVQKQLLDTEPHLLQTTGRDLSRLPVEELDVGLAPPQRERLRERVRGPFGLTQLQLLRTPRRQVVRTARRRPRHAPGPVGTRAGWFRSGPAR